MQKHFIFDLNPQANISWDRSVLRNPLTGERPNFEQEIAEELNNCSGSYLLKVTLQIEVLEQQKTPMKKLANTSEKDSGVIAKGNIVAPELLSPGKPPTPARKQAEFSSSLK